MSLGTSALAQDSLSVTPSSSEAGEFAIYTLTFVTTDTLRPDGQVTVTFPPNMDLSGVKMAGSSTINGGFNVTRLGQKVVLTRSGLGRSIMPGEKATIKFAVVKNPIEAGVSLPVQVEFDHKSKRPISISVRRKLVNLVFQTKSK
ncbi:hypothetical protein MJD09_19715 [bacterium]|nr:hypothetical protein [bacterium]